MPGRGQSDWNVLRPRAKVYFLGDSDLPFFALNLNGGIIKVFGVASGRDWCGYPEFPSVKKRIKINKHPFISKIK